MDSLSASSQLCTQLTAPSRFAMVQTNSLYHGKPNAHKHLDFDRLVCQGLPCICFHCPNLGLMGCTWSSMLYSVLYMHVLWGLALSCTVDFPPQQLPRIYTFILATLAYWYYAYLLSFTLICCIHSGCRTMLNYVGRGLSLLCGGHGELPHEVL